MSHKPITASAVWIWAAFRRIALRSFLLRRRRTSALHVEPAPVPPPEPSAAQRAFAQHRSAFRDLYVDLWRVAEGDEPPDTQNGDVLARWRERLVGVGDPDLLSAWGRLVVSSQSSPTRRAASLWLAELESWGLTRVNPKKITVDDVTMTQFQVFPRRQLGAVAVISEPAWAFGGETLQRGTAIME